MSQKKIKKSLVLILIVSLTISSSNIIVAKSIQKNSVGEVQIVKEKEEVLNQDEIESLIHENEDFSKIYNEQINKGAILEEVTVTEVELADNSRTKKKNGKIYDSSFRQPVKRKTIYLNKFCNTLSDLTKPTLFGVGFTPQYIWVPVSLFGLQPDMLNFVMDNGREEIIQDETYHDRLVSWIDSSTGKEWNGYSAGYSHIALSIIHVHEDKNKNKFHKTVDRTLKYYSKNYNNKKELLRLAKTVSMFTEEYVKWPDKEVIK